jgi:cation:H+ antiporter
VEIFLNFLYLAVGLALLYFGAEWLVNGSTQIALKFGMSPLVVGLTIVAFATSSPELFLGISANLDGLPEVAVGNVVGSNICNIALILGVAAMIRPIKIQSEIVLREMPILIFVTIAFIGVLWDGSVHLWEGIVLTLGIFGYVGLNLYLSKKEKMSRAVEKEFGDLPGQAGSEEELARSVWFLVGIIIFSLLVLVGGAQLMLYGGENVALEFGVSPALIALTIFAFGTSLPELATSIVASVKNQGDITTGNAIGSCVFNILAIIGITTLVSPMHFSGINQVDLWVMLGVTLVVFPLMWSSRTLARGEGAILLIAYVAYIVFRARMG